MQKKIKSETNSNLRAEDLWPILRIVSIHGLVESILIGQKVCVNPIKTVVNRLILRAKDLPRVEIRGNLCFTPYTTRLVF